jgi:UDP-glucose 4-epimerase
VNRTALITGAFGFIGRHVARHLHKSGWRVVGIGHGTWSDSRHREWGLDHWQSAEVALDALAAFERMPDLVVHCAGSGSVSFSIEQPEEDRRRNVSTTEAVLEFIRARAPAASVVLLSSAAVYGQAVEIPSPETAARRPVSPYGMHKLAAEELCHSYAAKFGLACAIVRLFSVYARELRKQVLWDACQKFSRDTPARFYGTGLETRDWLHVDDAASLIELAAARADRTCPVVNGGTGTATELRHLLQHVSRLFQRRDGPSFTGEAREGDPTHYRADNRLAQSWGWRPTIAWEDGVKDYVAWFRREAA